MLNKELNLGMPVMACSEYQFYICAILTIFVKAYTCYRLTAVTDTLLNPGFTLQHSQ